MDDGRLVCRTERSDPLPPELAAQRPAFLRLVAAIVAGESDLRLSPVQAYAILFNRSVPRPIQRSIRRSYRRSQPNGGLVYVLTHRGIGVPNAVKIGLTTRKRVVPRLREHARMLGLAVDEIVPLATVPCRDVATLERVVHRLLRDDRLYDLVCARTGHSLTEYFRCTDVRALETLVRAIALDIDRLHA